MHPSFGIEHQCPSTRWADVIKGPPQEAVLAHTFKVLNYRALITAQTDREPDERDGPARQSACPPQRREEDYAAAA